MFHVTKHNMQSELFSRPSAASLAAHGLQENLREQGAYKAKAHGRCVHACAGPERELLVWQPSV